MAAPTNTPDIAASSSIAGELDMTWSTDAQATDAEVELRPADTLISGNQNATLFAIRPNEAIDLGAYSCPALGPDFTICETNSNYSGFVYDDTNHQMLLFGGGHSATYRDDVDAFDLTNALTWAPEYQPTPCAEITLDNVQYDEAYWITSGYPISRHTYDLLAVAGTTPELWLMGKLAGRGSGCNNLDPTNEPTSPYVIADGRFAAYNIATKTWRYTNTPAKDFNWAIETDPVSGLILLASKSELATFDPDTDTYTTILTGFNETFMTTGRGLSLVYSAVNDKFYVMALTSDLPGVWEISFDRTTPSNTTIQNLNTLQHPQDIAIAEGWSYDQENGLIVGGIEDEKVRAFDPVGKVWHTRQFYNGEGISVGTADSKCLAYDPVNKVHVFRTNASAGYRTWAYRWA